MMPKADKERGNSLRLSFRELAEKTKITKRSIFISENLSEYCQPVQEDHSTPSA